MAGRTCQYHPDQTIDVDRAIQCSDCANRLPPTTEWWKKNFKLSEKALGDIGKDLLGENKRSLIEFTRTKKIEKHLDAIGKDLGRIADALEMILSETYGYQSQPPEVDTSGPEPQVTYTNQDEFDISEIAEEVEEK